MSLSRTGPKNQWISYSTRKWRFESDENWGEFSVPQYFRGF